MNLMKSKKTKFFFKFSKKNYTIFFFLLIIFSIYCSLTIGRSWDEGAHLKTGKITLDYLFSLGKIDTSILYREQYSPIYWSLQYLLTQIFPYEYRIEVTHLTNLIFSFSAIVGIGKLSKELFNQKIGKIVFLVLFFYPIFFGHMSFNGKDMFLAFCHVWIFYLVIRYLKKQDIRDKANKYIIFLGILAASATGLELVFFGSLIPIFLFVLIEIYFLKNFISKNFNQKKLYFDLGKIFLVFYFLLILFWIDTHPNIFILPFNFFLDHLSLMSGELYSGWPFNLLNGEYYLSWQVPKLHFLINLIYKSPEYFLACYIIFFIIFIKSNIFFREKFKFFIFKLIILVSIMIIPIVIGFIGPIKAYDGMRHYLWSVPYFCIIPGLTIYYLIENFNFIKPKLTLLFLSAAIIYFLFNFFMITPYQYTYLNIFNGEAKNRYQKFENDYWGTSIKELIKYANFENNKDLKIATCGINPAITKKYLEKKGLFIHKFVAPEESDYLIMTNRVIFGNEKGEDSKKMINCFDKYKGNDVFKIMRNGLILSVIRKIKT